MRRNHFVPDSQEGGGSVLRRHAHARTSGTGRSATPAGPQLIAFKPFVAGRSWKVGTAIVYHDHDDIKSDFAEFYALFARDNVLAGSLVEAFEHVEKTTTQMFAAISFVQDPDRELIRNQLWSEIARTMGPLLTDQPENLADAKIRESLSRNVPQELSATGAAIRTLFAPEIAEAKLTILHGVDEQSAEWNNAVNQLVDRLFRDDERFVFAAFRSLRSRGRRIAIALDNTDQLGEAFQEKVFLFSQRLSSEFSALCIVALREEKFFAAYRRGIVDAFGDRHFHIGSPDLKKCTSKALGVRPEDICRT